MTGEPPVVAAENLDGTSPYVLLCEHASNYIPGSYDGLGVDRAELERHIAWDIGAASLARLLSAALDAPLLLSGRSRLLIDCNRPPGTPTSIPERSEDTVIPGNRGLSAPERLARETAYFEPFRAAVAAVLDRRAAAHIPTLVLGVHSFTPVFQGIARPWHAGVLYGQATAFGRALLAGLTADPALAVGDNQPYRIEPEHDYTVPIHGDARGIPAALLEVRQDLLSDDVGVASWADRLVPVLLGAAGRSQ